MRKGRSLIQGRTCKLQRDRAYASFPAPCVVHLSSPLIVISRWIHKNRMSGMWTTTACADFLEKEGTRTVLFTGVNTGKQDKAPTLHKTIANPHRFQISVSVAHIKIAFPKGTSFALLQLHVKVTTLNSEVDSHTDSIVFCSTTAVELIVQTSPNKPSNSMLRIPGAL